MSRLGLASFDKSAKDAKQFSDLSSSLNQSRFKELANQLEVFQAALLQFATEHRDEIRNSPEFRSKFINMCHTIGVDPLATSANTNQGGSFWASLLGRDINDYYFQLAVKVVEACRATKDKNGGLMSMSDIITYLGNSNITESDIKNAIDSLHPLGGFDIIEFGSKRKKMVRSVPMQLSNDQSTLLGICQNIGYLSKTIISDNLQWNNLRISSALEDLVSSGLVWIDLQATEPRYYLPMLF
ncbi:hypothetical protein CANCADRAFT_3539 [Tortispora caseinolytica NRRL Y-17796]|uniref:Vacuolar-sorting protein SNF8 n=1 Tax=Tortispora caseinolytica NRRL Y-17796 TaxID=767744 RepID=A0A1E4TAU1_9ASCO|nr:hypothetical protein CANCADRAFT_3539 [Tortispora caseinolytica NRRL Y-17796]